MSIRQYKIAYQLFNLFKKGQLKHNIPLYKKYGLKKKYFSSLSSEDFSGRASPLNSYDQKDSSVEMPRNADFNSLSSAFRSALLPWSEQGYAILNRFFSDREVDACNEAVDRLIATKKVKFTSGDKLMFAFHHASEISSMGQNEDLLRVLRVIMDKKVQLFQSINFLKGSQQRTHSDAIHMTTFPFGNLIAVWVALEDIQPTSGPLHYYPGSHKLPYVMNRDYDNVGTTHKLGTKKYADYEDHIADIVAKNKLTKEVFTAQKGDVLIWHANLLHGGEEVEEAGSTRKSMVFHYYAEDAICFHEITQRPALKRRWTR